MTCKHTAAVDVGNTRTKACLFSHSGLEPEQQEHWPSAQAGPALALWLDHHRPERVAWCSVAAEGAPAQQAIEAYAQGGQQRLTAPSSGLKVQYATPHTLGADRLAAVWGARATGATGHVVAVDAGTAITYDVLLADGRYLGGAISPGAHLRMQALHHYTARLPLPDERLVSQSPNLLGSDTHSSLLVGAHWGTAAEVNQYAAWLCQWLNRNHPGAETQVFLTGGDAPWLYPRLNSAIFSFLPHLVLQGLHHWLTISNRL